MPIVECIVFVVDIVKIEYENNKQTIYSNNTHVGHYNNTPAGFAIPLYSMYARRDTKHSHGG